MAFVVRNIVWSTDLDLLDRSISSHHIHEFYTLQSHVQKIQPRLGNEDVVNWKFIANHCFTVKSAYQAQFFESTCTISDLFIWKVWMPLKCKFFSWLAIQNRIWTTDRLVAKNWHHAPSCVLCALESGIHFFVECRFTSRERSAMLSGCNRKGLRSLLILVIWSIWRERNARIFDHIFSSCQQNVANIKCEAAAQKLAGARHLTTHLSCCHRCFPNCGLFLFLLLIGLVACMSGVLSLLF